MPDIDPNEFTNREKLILEYYRSRRLSDSRPHLQYYLWLIITSLICLVLAVAHQDSAFGFVAYALLLGLVYYLLAEGRRWSKDYKSIFAKYEAKLKVRNEALKEKTA